MLDSTFFLSFLVHLSCLSLSFFFPSIYISFCTSFLYMSFPLLVSCNLYSSIRSSRNKQKRVQSWWPTSSLLFSSYICRFQNDGNNHQETQEIEGKADLVSIPSTNLNPKTHDPLLDSLQGQTQVPNQSMDPKIKSEVQIFSNQVNHSLYTQKKKKKNNKYVITVIIKNIHHFIFSMDITKQ